MSFTILVFRGKQLIFKLTILFPFLMLLSLTLQLGGLATSLHLIQLSSTFGLYLPKAQMTLCSLLRMHLSQPLILGSILPTAKSHFPGMPFTRFLWNIVVPLLLVALYFSGLQMLCHHSLYPRTSYFQLHLTSLVVHSHYALLMMEEMRLYSLSLFGGATNLVIFPIVRSLWLLSSSSCIGRVRGGRGLFCCSFKLSFLINVNFLCCLFIIL
mmetsp:Transcript_1283/g.1846  ORF Transcript_1283/g.1846 Transcript_1283/m.1846 type:complete len:212 (+) Transcript_1283:3144-3779(+)